MRGGCGRHHEAIEAELCRQHPGMGWTCATIGEEGEVARIVAALHRHATQKIRHAGIENLTDSPGGLEGAETKRLRNLLVDGATGRSRVELHAAADEIVRIQHAEHEIGVC